MAWRNYDWGCQRCGNVREDLVEVPRGEMAPRSAKIACGPCGKDTQHERLLSMPAKYLGEKQRSPVVYGGKFDTAGYKALPALPDPPDGLSGEGVADFFQSPDYKAAKKERAVVAKENAAKRKRLAAHKRTNGGVDFRRNRLKGDPKMTG